LPTLLSPERRSRRQNFFLFILFKKLIYDYN